MPDQTPNNSRHVWPPSPATPNPRAEHGVLLSEEGITLDMEPGFDFLGGEVVRLLGDHPDDGLKAGDAGYVWGVYNFSPPFYEATFYVEDGTGRDMMFTADEVERVDDPTSVPIPDDVHAFWQRMAEAVCHSTAC